MTEPSDGAESTAAFQRDVALLCCAAWQPVVFSFLCLCTKRVVVHFV